MEEMEDLVIPFEVFRLFGYLDTTHVKTCRPGSGPVEDGSRRNKAHQIQKAFCSTYLKAHGLKFQSVCLPNGMWGNAWGCLMRHNDLGVLNLSGLADDMIQKFAENGIVLENGSLPALFCDSIYHNTLVLARKIENPTDAEELLNERCNSARQSIELLYGDLFGLFHLLHYKDKFCLFRKGKEMYAIVIVCMFLQNCYTCYYGNKVQSSHCADKVDIDNILI